MDKSKIASRGPPILFIRQPVYVNSLDHIIINRQEREVIMKRISININELIKIKTNLVKSLNALDPLLNGIETNACDEFWDFIPDIQEPVGESLDRINRVLQLDMIQSGVKNAFVKFKRNELIAYIEDNKLDILVKRDKSDENLRKEIAKALIGGLLADRQ